MKDGVYKDLRYKLISSVLQDTHLLYGSFNQKKIIDSLRNVVDVQLNKAGVIVRDRSGAQNNDA